MDYSLAGGLGLMMSIFLLLFLVPYILFLVTQQNTLKAIQPQNRAMPPGEVWLQLIPLFNLVWQFVVVTRISDSIRRELSSANTFSFEEQQQTYPENASGERPTYGIGMAYCVLYCCSLIPGIGGLLSIAGLVCWIIYWVQLSEHKNKIQAKYYSGNI